MSHGNLGHNRKTTTQENKRKEAVKKQLTRGQATNKTAAPTKCTRKTNKATIKQADVKQARKKEQTT